MIEKDNAAVWVFYYLRRSCLITEYSVFRMPEGWGLFKGEYHMFTSVSEALLREF